MSENNPKIGWIEEIAQKSKLPLDDVKNVIDKYNIEQSPSIGRPKRLYIKSLKFSGQKQGVFTNNFSFKYDDFSKDVFAFLSDENLRGKTTILEMIKWMLRGSSSKDLQVGVKNWVKAAQLDFYIADIGYTVKLNQEDGEVSGELIQKNKNNSFVVAQFFSNDEFENSMSDFMMQELSLNKITAFRKSSNEILEGSVVTHKWSALSSVLYISTDYSALFGENVNDGLSNRLMNMYLGLPWIATYIALKSVEKKIESTKKVNQIHENKEEERRKKRLKSITKELGEKQKILKSFPDDSKIRKEQKLKREEYSRLSRNITNLDNEKRRLTSESEKIKNIVIQDKIKIDSFKEDRAAKVVFKRLNPTCCPHCETPISKERVQKEKIEHQCAVCDEPMLESENAEVLLTELVKNLDSSKKVSSVTQKKLKEVKNQHFKTSVTLKKLEERIKELDNELAKLSGKEKVSFDVMRLEILQKEYSIKPKMLVQVELKEKVIDEKRVIKKAIEVTKSRFENLQKDLLKQVSSEILRMSKIVGLDSVENVILNSVPHLKLKKDGINTSYSKCTKGEKLRLKVITNIALLSVTEKNNVGRHPGLLLIDSPRAQEISDHDLNNLIEGLKKLSDELPFLQIILASRTSEIILNQIDEKHRKHAKGNDYLW